MELRESWTILRRRWWLALIPALLVSGIGLAMYAPPPTLYGTTVRLTASLPPTAEESGFDPAYYSWLSSEYIVTALAGWMKTTTFAKSVSADLAAEGIDISPATIRGGLVSDFRRSELVLYLSLPSPEHLTAMAESAVDVLQEQNGTVFPQLGGENAIVVALDEPQVAASPPSIRSRLELFLRIGIGIAFGVALAFAAHYLDPMVRTRTEVERLGLICVGEIPARKRPAPAPRPAAAGRRGRV